MTTETLTDELTAIREAVSDFIEANPLRAPSKRSSERSLPHDHPTSDPQ